jgi:hypothetical protein
VSSLVALPSLKHQVTNMEVSIAHVLVMVASEILLVSCGVQQGYISSLLKLVEGILSCSIIALFVLGFQPRGSILQVGWKHGLGPINQEKWSEPRVSTRCCS